MTITLLVVFYGYFALGAVFGVYFIGWGATRIDPNAHGMSISMRLLLWPASAALWPVLLGKVLYRHALANTKTSSDQL